MHTLGELWTGVLGQDALDLLGWWRTRWALNYVQHAGLGPLQALCGSSQSVLRRESLTVGF